MRNRLFLLVLMFIIFITSYFFLDTYAREAMNVETINVHFLSSKEDSIISENVLIPKDITKYEKVEFVLNLLADPQDVAFSPIFHSDVSVNSIDISYNSVTIDLSYDYKLTSPIARTMSDACILSSLVQIEDIEKVKITVEGEERSHSEISGYMTEDSVILSTTELSEGEVDVNLYFLDDGTMRLSSISESLEISPTESVEFGIVSALFSPPEDSSLKSAIPIQIKLNSAYTASEICYVDLANIQNIDNDIIFTYSETLVYSIVNSLTSIDGINSVQILIDGLVVDTLGNTDVGFPLVSKNVNIK